MKEKLDFRLNELYSEVLEVNFNLHKITLDTGTYISGPTLNKVRGELYKILKLQLKQSRKIYKKEVSKERWNAFKLKLKERWTAFKQKFNKRKKSEQNNSK